MSRACAGGKQACRAIAHAAKLEVRGIMGGKWNLEGWRLQTLIKLQASWQEMSMAGLSQAEQASHQDSLNEVAAAIAIRLQQGDYDTCRCKDCKALEKNGE